MQYIAIHSVPRSGSTWLGQIFNSHPKVNFSYQPLFSFAFKDYLNEASSSEDIEAFFKNISSSDDDFINQKEDIKKGIVPDFSTDEDFTHICYKEVRYHHILENLMAKHKSVKLILLIRNPLATLYSWKNAPKEFRADQGWDFEKEWQFAPSKNLDKKEEFNGYDKWKEATILYHNLKKQYPERVTIISYNELMSDTLSVVERLFNFVDLKVDELTTDFLKKSTSVTQADAYSVFKQRTKDENWKALPKHIIDYIFKDLQHSELEIYLD